MKNQLNLVRTKPFKKGGLVAENKLIIGKLGSAHKTITMIEGKFKEELVPKNAVIQYGEINGEKIVTMTYRVG